MFWLTPAGEYLVEGEVCSLSYGAESLRDPGGSPLRAAKYYLCTATGEVTQAYAAPQVYSIEDELGVTNIHVVLSGTLHRHHYRQVGPREPEVRSEALVAGLKPRSRKSIPFDP